jgi:hypothetical protein
MPNPYDAGLQLHLQPFIIERDPYRAPTGAERSPKIVRRLRGTINRQASCLAARLQAGCTACSSSSFDGRLAQKSPPTRTPAKNFALRKMQVIKNQYLSPSHFSSALRRESVSSISTLATEWDSGTVRDTLSHVTAKFSIY